MNQASANPPAIPTPAPTSICTVNSSSPLPTALHPLADPAARRLASSAMPTGSASGWSAVGSGLLEFTVQMLVGAGVGIAGGLALAWFMRVPLPNGALYPLRTLGAAAAIYGAATVAHGSGFLAVFVAGI